MARPRAASAGRGSRRTRRAGTAGGAETSSENHFHTLLPQSTEEPSLEARPQRDHTVRLLLMQNLRVAMECGQQLPVAQRHSDLRNWSQRLSRGAEGETKILYIQMRNAKCGMRNCGGQYRVRITLADECEKSGRIRKQISLIEHIDRPLAFDAGRDISHSKFR